MTASIYLRVSTRDKGQDTENQLLQIKQLIERRGWKLGTIYEDMASASGVRRRPKFDLMMEHARKGKIELVVFWSLDRFSREGTRQTLDHLHNLDEWGVRFVSLQEEYLDTLGPFREAVIGVLAAVARMEQERLSERVRAGIQRRKARGDRVGGVPKPVDERALRRMRAEKWSLREIGRALHISHATVVNRCRELGI